MTLAPGTQLCPYEVLSALGGIAFESGVAQRLPLPPNVDVLATPQSTPDGQRFLVELSQDRRAPRTSISVVLNWPALLKQ